MRTSPKKIDQLIKEIKKRLKLRTLQHGISITLLTFVGFACFYFIGLASFEISSLIQTLIITIFVVALVIEIGWYIIRPAFSTIEDHKIALFIEERFPDMEDRINSAVELKGHPVEGKEESLIIDRLIDDATLKIKEIRFTTIIDRKKERKLAYVAYGLFFLFLLTTFSYMEDIRRISSNVEFSLNPKTHFGQEIINITPGNIQIEKGESVDIIAELKAATDEELFLHYKMADDVWAKEKMNKSIDGKKSIFRLISVQEPAVYYVELQEIRSTEFNIDIYEFPKVTQIDLKYHYPAYTGLPDRVEVNTGIIRGLQGSQVTLTIQTSGAPIIGELVLNDVETIKLTSQVNGIFQGKMNLRESGVYHIKLADGQEKNNKFPIEYKITAVEDALPIISINDPQKDVRVNAVDEVLIDVSISDDFGVKSAKIWFSVNGEEEESVLLFSANKSRETEITGDHIFYLEDYFLEPGDVISYYVEAEDNFLETEAIQSDMYFIEVIPFDSKFTQLNNRGGGGGGGQQGSQMVINQQTIISSTWNLLRKKNEMQQNEFDESVDAIKQSQSNLKDNINERINTTAFSVEMAVDDENKEIADLLRKSVEQMDQAVKVLSEKDLKKALTPERKALTLLLRADAKNKEKLIQRGQMAGGGGGGNSEDRMTELMDLELDISKDKYEIQQQNQQQQNQQLDDTLRKLRELAKKQQLLAQQSREILQEQNNRRELDRLKRDQEQLRNDAENLASQFREQARNNDKISRQMQNRIDEITKNLRNAEQDLKNNNFQQAMARQSQAINELNRLQNDLRLSLSDDVRDMLDEFTDNFREFDEQERQLANDISEEYKRNQENEGIVNTNRLKNLVQKREELIGKLNNLEDQARAIEESSRQENPKIATSLRNIQNTIQRENIEKNMRGSKELLERGWLTYANMLEEEIKAGISMVEDQVKQLQGGLPVTEEQRLNRSLEDTRDLMRRFQETMAQNQRQSQEQTQGQPQPGNNNQQEAQEGDQPRGGNRGRAGRNEAARMRNLFERARETLERMEREYQDDTDFRQQLNNTRRMFSQGNVGTLLGGKAKEYFKNKVYDPLSQLETYLLNRLDRIELEKKLYSLRKEEVPPEYKKMVDKYFESISK